MRVEKKLYGVQRVLPGRREPVPESVLIEASSPVAAGERVVGCQLIPVGSPANLRALVWHMQPDFTPVCTSLYEPENLDRGLRAHRLKVLARSGSAQERRVHIHILIMAIVVAVAIAILILQF
ncbi:hypothetical protein ASE94_04500 [Devosia sp. Leaf64]|nr:hypothetical protein ASE94_04500 [Devosia sp. Leaf64]